MSDRCTPPSRARIFFETSLSYEAALRSITNLGLQPATRNHDTRYKHGVIEIWMPWYPVGGREFYIQILHGTLTLGRSDEHSVTTHSEETHAMWVKTTPLAPMNWIYHLNATPGICHIEIPEWFTSAFIHTDQPPNGAIFALAEHQANTYVRITFSLSACSYDSALYLISNIGLRLAEPGYEQSQEKGISLPWHAMGQENVFVNEHALIAATTTLSPIDWESRLRSAPEIVAIEVPCIL